MKNICDIIKEAEINHAKCIEQLYMKKNTVYRDVFKRPLLCCLFHKRQLADVVSENSNMKKFFCCNRCGIIWSKFSKKIKIK